MTTISSDAYSFSTAATTSSSSSSASAVAKDDIMGKEDFLTLLVAQLKNQDPLDPEDPTDFTAQLAQFSSLEQLYNLNDSMEALATAQVNSDTLQGLSLIGQNITYNESSFSFDGEPVEVGYQLDGTAESVTLSIQDADGKTVHTLQASSAELDAGNHLITWDGTDQDGNIVADGEYTIVLQATAEGEDASVAAAPLVKSEVTGVDLSTGMITTNLGEVLFSNIIGVSALSSDSQTSTTETASSLTTKGTTTTATNNDTATTDDEQTAQDIIDSFIQQT